MSDAMVHSISFFQYIAKLANKLRCNERISNITEQIAQCLEAVATTEHCRQRSAASHARSLAVAEQARAPIPLIGSTSGDKGRSGIVCRASLIWHLEGN
eukprot:444668-Pleurochrysis_carterae.AAC.1